MTKTDACTADGDLLAFAIATDLLWWADKTGRDLTPDERADVISLATERFDAPTARRAWERAAVI